MLSCVGVLVSSVSIWAHRTIFNTDRWVATVGPLAQNDAVIKAVSARLTHEVDTAINPEEVAKRLLPTPLEGLAVPISQEVNRLIGGALTGVLHSDAFQHFWIATNKALQPRVAAILKGKPTPHLETAGGTIQLNLLPLVAKVLSAVQSHAPGLLKTHGPIPSITAATPVDTARMELSKALGRTLPPSFGTVTLFKSHQLAVAQHLVRVFDVLIVVLVVLTIAFMVMTMVLAERRRRALIILALGVAVSMGLAFALVKVITNQLVAAITDPDDRGAVRAIVGTVISGLNDIAILLIGLGVIVAVVAFLVGSSRPAASIRRSGATIGRSLFGRTKERPASPLLSWVARYRVLLSLAGLAVAVVILLVVVAGWIGLLVLVLTLGAYEGLVAWAARRAQPASTAQVPNG